MTVRLGFPHVSGALSGPLDATVGSVTVHPDSGPRNRFVDFSNMRAVGEGEALSDLRRAVVPAVMGIPSERGA